MTITSFSFYILVSAGVILYYLIPRSLQWIELLILSIIFYCMATTPYTLCYLMVSTLIAWSVTNGLERYRNKTGAEEVSRLWKILVISAVIINILLWFVLKGKSFFSYGQKLLGILFPEALSIELIELTSALGMGYYTLQIIGYMIDCYWETVKPQRNILKLFLFTSFFPQLVTGPISRYSQLTDLYEKHKFSYINVTHGAQRILYGVFKKLVLAERAGAIVNGIWGDLSTFNGIYVWIAILLYPIQMYADFSGCMDIVIGTAEMFDIKLAENFNNPFFSRTSQEFWQRWHITLGTWAKDYVLYPLLKSKTIVKLGKSFKKKFGKKTGKFLTTAVGMLVLWMVMGIWHGAPKYVIGVSLWYWIILMLGELTTPFTCKITVRLRFKTKSFSWNLFRMIRTYFIYAIGAVFFRAEGISEAVCFLKEALQAFGEDRWNPWMLFNGSILNLTTYMDLNIIIFAIAVVLLVGILREKYGYAREWLDRQAILFRWFVWLGIFSFVLIYGMYGAGYDAAEFIYQGF